MIGRSPGSGRTQKWAGSVSEKDKQNVVIE